MGVVTATKSSMWRAAERYRISGEIAVVFQADEFLPEPGQSQDHPVETQRKESKIG
jgi:hypothetical protein